MVYVTLRYVSHRARPIPLHCSQHRRLRYPIPHHRHQFPTCPSSSWSLALMSMCPMLPFEATRQFPTFGFCIPFDLSAHIFVFILPRSAVFIEWMCAITVLMPTANLDPAFPCANKMPLTLIIELAAYQNIATASADVAGFAEGTGLVLGIGSRRCLHGLICWNGRFQLRAAGSITGLNLDPSRSYNQFFHPSLPKPSRA